MEATSTSGQPGGRPGHHRGSVVRGAGRRFRFGASARAPANRPAVIDRRYNTLKVMAANDALRLFLNGEETTLELPRATVAELVLARRPSPPFAVELNKRLVRRVEYDSTLLHEGDRVEIVTLVGGG